MRRFQKGPALGYFSARNSPDHNSAKLDLLLRRRVGSPPVVKHHDLVVFGNYVLNLHVDIRKPPTRSSNRFYGISLSTLSVWPSCAISYPASAKKFWRISSVSLRPTTSSAAKPHPAFLRRLDTRLAPPGKNRADDGRALCLGQQTFRNRAHAAPLITAAVPSMLADVVAERDLW